MKTLDDTKFDPTETSKRKYFGGIFPAHIVKFERRNEFNQQVEVKGEKGVTYEEMISVPFNLTFRIAPQAVNVTGVDDEGNQVNGESMIGAEFYLGNRGLWLSYNPPQGHGWKNNRYVEFCQNLGIEFKTDEEGNLILGEIEEEDALGKPCLVRLEEEEHYKDKTKKYFRVIDIYTWEEGTPIDVLAEEEDDLPF